MNTQPEALWLADALDRYAARFDAKSNAAAELRRLHEAHDWQYKMAGERLRRIEKLEASNQELLEVLKLADALLSGANMNASAVEKKVRAAIAKHGGEV